MERQIIRDRVNELLAHKAAGQYEEIKELLLSNEGTARKEKDLAIAMAMIPVCEQEKEEGQCIVFDKVANLKELVDRYMKLMFYLRRFDFDVAEEHLEGFNQFIKKYQVSLQELFIVLYCGVVDKDKVLQIIKEKIVLGDLVL